MLIPAFLAATSHPAFNIRPRPQQTSWTLQRWNFLMVASAAVGPSRSVWYLDVHNTNVPQQCSSALPFVKGTVHELWRKICTRHARYYLHTCAN
jgi:hypothetical protein